jgi:hypothetical protein
MGAERWVIFDQIAGAFPMEPTPQDLERFYDTVHKNALEEYDEESSVTFEKERRSITIYFARFCNTFTEFKCTPRLMIRTRRGIEYGVYDELSTIVAQIVASTPDLPPDATVEGLRDCVSSAPIVRDDIFTLLDNMINFRDLVLTGSRSGKTRLIMAQSLFRSALGLG